MDGFESLFGKGKKLSLQRQLTPWAGIKWQEEPASSAGLPGTQRLPPYQVGDPRVVKATNSTVEVEPFVAGECLYRGPEVGGK